MWKIKNNTYHISCAQKLLSQVTDYVLYEQFVQMLIA